MAHNIFNKPHLFLNSNVAAQEFTSPPSGGGGNSKEIPPKDRIAHSGKLRGDLATVSSQLDVLKSSSSEINLQMGIGIQIEFEGYPDVQLAVEQLANANQGIDLHNIKTVAQGDHSKTIATVFVPDGKLQFFEKKIEDYLNRKKASNDKPLDNQKLIDAIQSIRVAVFEAIWSDADDLLPANKDEAIWWEVWLSAPKKPRNTTSYHQAILSDFTAVADQHEVEVSIHTLKFPEHIVVQVKASQNQLASNMLLLCRIAEIRAPKVMANFFDAQNVQEQAQWSDELLNRLELPTDGNEPYICILDTGVNAEHPLLAPFTGINDQLTVMDNQYPVDNHGHGTNMAGLAIWGDLTEALASEKDISVGHKLESVKVINRSGDNKDKPLGLITSDAVSVAELAHSERDRIFSMSLSANADSDQGRPSSWSSTLDSLASDYMGEGAYPKLFTVCAGNAFFNCFKSAQYPYPDFNFIQSVSDPAQAWNVITVGAFTDKVSIQESSDHYPLANAGGLSPHTTTSLSWDRKNAPLKPEVVFEGGNIGKSEHDYRDDIFDLHLLTTHSDFSQRHYQTSSSTSAATALAARFAAQVKIEYPDLWPETVRALMVHSAEWTSEMLKLINQEQLKKSIPKKDISELVRIVGFGVPNLEKALKSASNSLFLIIQSKLQPFQKEGSGIKTKDMHLHDLPWPKESLMDLGAVDVELTVTLSYFVEPNPSSRNIINKYSYASHQLRFDVKRPLESDMDFQKRVNKQNRDDKSDKPDSTNDSNWIVGIANRHRGSIHKDIWKGSAAELAECGQIAIFPANGWWRTRTSHKKWDSEARYALTISLSVPEVDVDIYTDVKTKIDAMIESKTKATVTAET